MPCRTQTFTYMWAILFAAAVTSADDQFSMITAYLQQFGIHSLPRLSMHFGSTEVDGGTTFIQRSKREKNVLREQPTVEWDPAYGRTAVLFLDLDCGGRPSADLSKAGRMGPLVHSLWQDCKGSTLASCGAITKPYLTPGATKVPPNRYTWLLLQQPGTALLRLPASLQASLHPSPNQKVTMNGLILDLASFFADNPGVKPLAYNFILVGGGGPWARVSKNNATTSAVRRLTRNTEQG